MNNKNTLIEKKEIKELIKNCQIIKFKKNQVIFNKNDYGNSFYIIKSGRVKLCTSFSGKTKIFAVLKENEFFGELALLGIKYRTASAIAISNTELYSIPADKFIKIILKSNNICIEMLKILAERLKKADEEIERLVFYNLLGRTMLFIYDKYTECGTDELDITQQDLACYLGTTRVPVNRIINTLKKRGIILKSVKGKIRINPNFFKKTVLK